MVTPTVFDDLDRLRVTGPSDLGATEWCTFDARSVATFCTATEAPIPKPGEAAPPLFLLSLTNRFMPALIQVPSASNGINYGADQVRFPTPARPGDRIRARAFLMEVAEVAGGVQTRIQVRIEVEGADEPCCVVESLSRWLT